MVGHRPRHGTVRLLCLAGLLLLFLLTTAMAADEPVSVGPREQWSTVFGGKDVTYHLEARTTAAFKGKVAWTFAVGSAVAQRGEAEVTAAPNRPATVTVKLRIPEVRAGVAVQALLSASAVAAG